ncbi:3-oxoadipate enol-lactonase [Streptomyces sp. CB02923]|uniref:bifunctional 3-oxoadipate enol-lactonase/4-carboxymuconolactone decarboxylase PcaDC n=1 Tax=Streptomyces sp. CB02923 TaxID=1718985 RepID=UPI000939DE4D|nr:3-oxoadipate enol-lactonase [Streptomyces sp. CB02923]OKI01100.1 3-oxoadipate enol-lactonase [Streptomyces sp. CB02923]
MTTSAPPPLPHHREDGPADAPPLVLGPSLGTSLSVWEPQAEVLARRFRVVRWDLPGHGGTPYDVLAGRTDGPCTVAGLGGLVLALADSLGIDRFAYAGISLGGAVGAWLAVHHPDRIASLALVCSSARFGEPGTWHERAALVREQGLAPVAATAADRWFTPAFAGSPAADGLLAGLRTVAPEGYAACCDALATYDLRGELGRIGAPTLVVAGRDDPATPPAHARQLADGIPAASLTEVAGAAHLANAEQPGPVLAALLGHLTAYPVGRGDAPDTDGRDTPDSDGCDAPDTDGRKEHPTDDGPRHAAGTEVRRAVLGDDHVDRAAARTTAFTAVFQDFITRYAWGEIWTRPGLSRHTRSCITLTALVAGGHREELALHLRAALRNGLTSEDIREVLLQSAVYCGVPAANSAFTLADRVLAEHREGK